MNKNTTICSAFWNHVNIRPGDRIFPCCRYKTPLEEFDGNVAEVLNSKAYYNLRNDSINGIENPNCGKCYHEERNGKSSLRQWFNKTYSIEEVQLKYLEIGFDNICNLTCDGCWEDWSSSWWIKKNPEKNWTIGILQTKDFFNIPLSIEKIVFLGGEPLMTNKHRKFLEKIKDLGNITVEYFTNGMFELSSQDKLMLDRCKDVKFTISIDGYGKLNEKIRNGSEWSKVQAFAKDLKYTKVIHTVIHKNSWRDLPEMKKWVVENNFSWTTNVLTYPDDLDVKNLSHDEKKELVYIMESNDIPNSDYIRSHLNL